MSVTINNTNQPTRRLHYILGLADGIDFATASSLLIAEEHLRKDENVNKSSIRMRETITPRKVFENLPSCEQQISPRREYEQNLSERMR